MATSTGAKPVTASFKLSRATVASHSGSKACTTMVCKHRSLITGMPNGLRFPLALGIGCSTGGVKVADKNGKFDLQKNKPVNASN